MSKFYLKVFIITKVMALSLPSILSKASSQWLIANCNASRPKNSDYKSLQ